MRFRRVLWLSCVSDERNLESVVGLDDFSLVSFSVRVSILSRDRKMSYCCWYATLAPWDAQEGQRRRQTLVVNVLPLMFGDVVTPRRLIGRYQFGRFVDWVTAIHYRHLSLASESRLTRLEILPWVNFAFLWLDLDMKPYKNRFRYGQPLVVRGHVICKTFYLTRGQTRGERTSYTVALLGLFYSQCTFSSSPSLHASQHLILTPDQKPCVWSRWSHITDKVTFLPLENGVDSQPAHFHVYSIDNPGIPLPNQASMLLHY